MTRQALYEIRQRVEAATPSYIDYYRTDIPKLLAYIDELEARCGKS